ncbi:MAG: hypothetical protein R3244_12210, partial [Thermoanaerobaculia bacterium]|nr:hypothetical protein [Thermoanaerobaculia bacterium]
VPIASLEPYLARASEAIEVRRVDGGHVGFAPDLDLGERGPLGLESQVVSWLARTLGRSPAAV